MAQVVVIGAGPMGLAAAYEAIKGGHHVDVLEAGPLAGGMSAHFDFGGISLERFYHFVCRDDQPTFDLMKELGIEGKMRWVPTSMGFFWEGSLHPWGNPLALLRFPGIAHWRNCAMACSVLFVCAALRGPILRIGQPRNGSSSGVGRKVMISSGGPCSTGSSTNIQTASRLRGCGRGCDACGVRERACCRRNWATSKAVRRRWWMLWSRPSRTEEGRST